jgi:hypothetical protein
VSDTVAEREVAEEPPVPAAPKHLVRHGPSGRWMTVFGCLLLVAVITAAALTYAGVKTVRESRAGQSVSTVTDPAAPGFEAFLEPTPTLAVLHADGRILRSMAVLALNAGDAGGSVLAVSPVIRIDPGEDAFGFDAVSDFGGGPERVLPSLQGALGFGITESVVVDDAKLAELVAPVAPLQVDNPSAVGPFLEGSLTLTADQVGPYLAAVNEGEAPQAAMIRQRAFYRAWIDAVAGSSDPAAVPGELEVGIGRFVRALAAGSHRVETVPTTSEPGEFMVRYDLDEDALPALVAELVRFPTAGRPGGRVRVRLLDGVGEIDHVQNTAPLVVPANAEIVVVGNAAAFDHTETEIRYHTPTARQAASDLQAALGAGRVIDDPRQTDAFDVTIVLGTDV